MVSWYKNLKVSGKLLFSFIIVLIVAVGSGAFALITLRNSNNTFEDAMETTSVKIAYIFEAKDHLSNARMIIREFYYPSNAREDIERSFADLNDQLDELDKVLTNLHKVASLDMQEKIETVIPLVDRYRKDVVTIADRLLMSGRISVDNPDFRTAQLRAEQMTKAINVNYANEMMQDIDSLSDMALNEVKVLAAGNSASAANAQFIAILLFAIMAVFVLYIAFYISGLISKPLVQLASFMKRAGATGDIKLRPDDAEIFQKYGMQKDEIGQTVSGSLMFVEHVTNISREMEAIASGDLTADIKPLSDNDIMGQSLDHMIDGLNFMFDEVHVATTQANMGSKHVAYGAQALAQNSSEQSASVENLSRAITDISQKTEKNFETAEKTSKLTDTIKENAEKGARQMDELMAAVKEINTASRSISRIMNAIDDISFQTNLLALNAAVEAARAGQHGRGFAIVAEEVRKLALRSADAAKETGELIQNSIEKAELGARIAGETAVSFAEIVSGINESNTLVALIADASKEQLQGIGQVNNGIDQVTRVVQQNSATAEESAAASEEMSSQANTLQELMTRFKIKEKSFTD